MTQPIVSDAILDSLTHLLVGQDERGRMTWPKARMRDFDGFEILGEALGGDDEDILLGSVTDLPFWPVDARWAMRQTHDGEDGWHFMRCASLRLADWRGKLAITSPRMFEVAEQFVGAAGAAAGSRAPLAVIGGGLVSALSRRSFAPRGALSGHMFGTTSGDRTSDTDYLTIAVAQGIELRREYCWSVLLGEDDIPRARFVTDAIGVREAFRLRDLPAGRTRRAALRHWVSAHWRRSRDTSAADRHAVRAFLRGATQFHWNGFSCVIEPSRDDVRRAAATKAV